MGWRRAWRPWAVGLVAMAMGAQVAAKGVTQEVPGHGEINWTDKTVTARGSGAPGKKGKTPAAKRLSAERAAKLDAYRNILETLKGVQVDASKSGADMLSNGEITAKVQGLLRGARVIDTVYYSDMSVDVVLRMPLDGALTQAMLPADKAPKKDVPSKGEAKNSGLVINAKGLDIVPAIAPKIMDEKGAEVYGVSFVADKALLDTGIVGYVKDVEAAKKHERVSQQPLVVRAVGTKGESKSDIVISNADADKLRDPATNLGFLAEGRVIIVMD